LIADNAYCGKCGGGILNGLHAATRLFAPNSLE
jgi:hypothetical protein